MFPFVGDAMFSEWKETKKKEERRKKLTPTI